MPALELSTVEALWRAIDAAPADSLLRGVLADWLDERNGPGDADTAAGLRATADKVPMQATWAAASPRLMWSWWQLTTANVDDYPLSNLTRELFAALSGVADEPKIGGVSYYPTARAAIADVVAAWVAVEREKGECKACERCGGQWSRSGGDPVNPRPCPACKGTGKATPAESRP